MSLYMAVVLFFMLCDFRQINYFEPHFNLLWNEDNKCTYCLLWGPNNGEVCNGEEYFATCHSNFNSNIIINPDGIIANVRAVWQWKTGQRRESQAHGSWHFPCLSAWSSKSKLRLCHFCVTLGIISIYFHSAF